MKANKLLVLASSTLLALTLVACGNDTQASSSSEATPTTLTYKEAAASALKNVGLVSQQVVSYEQWGDKTEITVKYGEDKNGKFVNIADKETSYTALYVYKYLSNGAFVGVNSYDNGESWSKSSSVTEAALGGKEFYFDQTYYGAEALINALAANKGCVETETDKANSWVISAEGETGGDYSNLYKAQVEFSLSDNGALANATFTITQYYSSNYSKNEDGTYTTTGDGSKVVYTVTNTCGEKLTADAYNVEQYFATSWTMTDDKGTTIDENYTLTTEAGNSDGIALNFKDILPATANLSVDSPAFTVYQGGVKCDKAYGYVSNNVGHLSISQLTAGEYTVEVKSAFKTATFKLVLTAAKPSKFDLTNYDYDLGKYTQRESYSNNEDGYNFTGSTYVNRPIYLVASTRPEAAGGKVVATCDDENVKIEETTINPTGYSEKDVLKVTASKVGTYKFNLYNKDYPDGIKATYTLTVTAAPSISDIVAKKYVATSYSGIAYEISFQSDSDSGESGRVTIVDNTDSKWDSETQTTTVTKHNNTYTYEYNEETNEFTLAIVSGTDAENETWTIPALGISSRGLPIVNSKTYSYSQNYECSEDTPEAKLVNRSFSCGNAYTKVDDVSNLVTYNIYIDKDSISLTFKDLRKATWVDDEYTGGYYDGIITYEYETTEGWSLSALADDDGYTINATFKLNEEMSTEMTEDDRLAQREIFEMITVSSDFSTLTVSTYSEKTYTLA